MKLRWAYYYKADSSKEIVETFKASSSDEAYMYIAQKKNLPLSAVHDLFEVRAIYENDIRHNGR